MSEVIKETVGDTTAVVTDAGVEVTRLEGLDKQAYDVVNSVSGWAENNPKTAVALGAVAVISTGVVVYQIGKKLLS